MFNRFHCSQNIPLSNDPNSTSSWAKALGEGVSLVAIGTRTHWTVVWNLEVDKYLIWVECYVDIACSTCTRLLCRCLCPVISHHHYHCECMIILMIVTIFLTINRPKHHHLALSIAPAWAVWPKAGVFTLGRIMQIISSTSILIKVFIPFAEEAFDLKDRGINIGNFVSLFV